MKRLIVLLALVNLILAVSILFDKCHPFFGELDNKNGCVAVVISDVPARYGKGDFTQNLLEGERVIVYYETDKDYVSFIQVDDDYYPAWISKSHLNIE